MGTSSSFVFASFNLGSSSLHMYAMLQRTRTRMPCVSIHGRVCRASAYTQHSKTSCPLFRFQSGRTTWLHHGPGGSLPLSCVPWILFSGFLSFLVGGHPKSAWEVKKHENTRVKMQSPATRGGCSAGYCLDWKLLLVSIHNMVSSCSGLKFGLVF